MHLRYHAESGEKSPDRPTLPEIEITEEMIDAGADMAQTFFSWELSDPEKLAALVFLAMWRARPGADPDGQTGNLLEQDG